MLKKKGIFQKAERKKLAKHEKSGNTRTPCSESKAAHKGNMDYQASNPLSETGRKAPPRAIKIMSFHLCWIGSPKTKITGRGKIIWICTLVIPLKPCSPALQYLIHSIFFRLHHPQ